MKVLHVINRYGWSGGAENQLSRNLAHFEDPGIQHAVVALYDHHEGASTRGFAAADVDFLFDDGESPGPGARYRRLLDRVRDHDPDLIHCSLTEAARASRLVGRRLGVPILESLVNISHETMRMVDNDSIARWKLAAHTALDRLTMPLVAHFHALSEAVANSWVTTAGIDRERVTIIPRGLDLSEFDTNARDVHRLAVRHELGVEGSTPVIVNTGRQEPQKGQRYLIEAMPEVFAEVPDAILLMVGRPGRSTRQIKALIEELGIDSRIRFLGVRDDVPRLLAAADAFVFPSLFEGMGVSFLEAMAAGTPCVVSDAMALVEIAGPSDSAVIVPARNSGLLAAEIIRTLIEPSSYVEMTSRARRLVESKFRIEDTARQMESLYRRVSEG